VPDSIPDIPDMLLGQAAGIATSMLWVATSIFFTAAGKRIGPTVVNTVRIFLAIALLGVTHRLLAGVWMPTMPGNQVALLAASGIIGLSIGDQALFTSFVYIGPRLAILIMSTSPIWATIFGWIALDEQLAPAALLGIAMTVGGVAWVVLERQTGNKNGPTNATNAENGAPGARPRMYTPGVALALLGSVCQALGLLLSKQGMGHGIEADTAVRIAPQTATLVRMTFAGLGVLPILLVQQTWRRKRILRLRADRAIAHGVVKQPPTHARPEASAAETGDEIPIRWRAGLLFTLAGSIAGPYLGVWMSLVAADHAPVGIAQTLCSLSPIMILPVVAIMGHEKITMRAINGAVLAVAGVAMLVFSDSIGSMLSTILSR